MLARYKSRSLVTGREISLCTEDSGDTPEVIAAGRVAHLTDDLELVLEGHESGFSKGRLALDLAADCLSQSS